MTALEAWYEDIRRAEGRLRLQLVTDLASKINAGEFDMAKAPPKGDGGGKHDAKVVKTSNKSGKVGNESVGKHAPKGGKK